MSATKVIKKTQQLPLPKPHHITHNRLKEMETEMIEISLDSEHLTEEQQTKTSASNSDNSDIWQGEQEHLDQDYFK